MKNESETDYAGNRNIFKYETTIIVNCILNALFMLSTVLGNSLVLAAILRTPSLRSSSITFLCSLAVSDLFVGLVVQPVYIAYQLTESATVFQILSIVAGSGCGFSLLLMTTITVDRFLALHYHMQYPNLMTSHRALYTSVTLWIVSLLLSLCSFWKMEAYHFAAAVSIAICLLLSSAYYVRIYRIAKKHQLQIHVQQIAVENHAGNINQTVLRSTKSAKNTFIYYIAMVLCYTPLFTSMSALAISPDRWTIAWTLADTAAFMNSSINPFLYCWRLREIRTAAVKTIRQMLCRQRTTH
ncbi:histamine H2 receptor-like [Orbicella faveolata]|uniref:histamine H2 receptor-like n=1 Tax=Orbicella faveolata TaxID=48498 RepID=UPI0009E50DB2|nr:histamine H2 receptor-like [Orbicella faveolata]